MNSRQLARVPAGAPGRAVHAAQRVALEMRLGVVERGGAASYQGLAATPRHARRPPKCGRSRIILSFRIFSPSTGGASPA